VCNQEKQEAATVLIVDDDYEVLKALRTILQGAGYHVLDSREGGDATEIFRTEHEAIGAVIMDWKMPGLDGHEWVRTMLDIDPDAQIIFCTAYEIPDNIRQRLESQVVGFVDKPINQRRLLNLVQRAVGADAAP
jgi:CheY-like chemotaxis protein